MRQMSELDMHMLFLLLGALLDVFFFLSAVFLIGLVYEAVSLCLVNIEMAQVDGNIVLTKIVVTKGLYTMCNGISFFSLMECLSPF
uniref:Uncharacterized protein n=1 Tax=Rhizophora mucronata TaxID=61149 RepID=A0A2P2J0L5_RHIMU